MSFQDREARAWEDEARAWEDGEQDEPTAPCKCELQSAASLSNQNDREDRR